MRILGVVQCHQTQHPKTNFTFPFCFCYIFITLQFVLFVLSLFHGFRPVGHDLESFSHTCIGLLCSHRFVCIRPTASAALHKLMISINKKWIDKQRGKWNFRGKQMLHPLNKLYVVWGHIKKLIENKIIVNAHSFFFAGHTFSVLFNWCAEPWIMNGK